jgi:hypothetical protein
MPLFRLIFFMMALMYALKNFAFLQPDGLLDQVLLIGFVCTVWGVLDDISVCAYTASDYWDEHLKNGDGTDATD